MIRFAPPSLAALLALLLTRAGPQGVDAHGHMTSPRSRNWVAAQDGYEGWDTTGEVGVPPKESCPHCLALNLGVCGRVNNGGRSYDPFLDSSGQEMPWTSQATYKEGQFINVKSYLSTHHKGHMIVSACPDGPNSTPECFAKDENKLVFVADPKFGMPADPFHPDRGYYWGGETEFEMIFKLPENVGIHGDEVMLQWKYITANSCEPPGYPDYFARNNLPASFWSQNLPKCSYPLPNDGSRSTVWPEQFYNCAEVIIEPLAPTPAPPPTVAPPPTEAVPTASAPTPTSPVVYQPTVTTGGPACCSRDFKNCNLQLEGWCSETQANCVGPCGKYWLIDGAITSGCTARYEPCSVDGDCCSPGVCKGGQCEASDYTDISGPGTGPTSPTGPTGYEPTPTPPTGPTTGGPTTTCCTQKFHECVSWCGSTEAECTNCNNDSVYWATIESGTGCKALDDGCTGSAGTQGGCCLGTTCVGDQYYAKCVKSTAAPPPTTTTTSTTTTTTNTPGPPVPNSCYSFNYRDCNHPDVPMDGGATCTPVFLPVGAQENCLALWDECTGQSNNDCCLDLVCHGDGTYAQCIEPAAAASAAASSRKMLAVPEAVNESPAPEDDDAAATSSSEKEKGCVVCDDVTSRAMIETGLLNCSSHDASRLENMCKGDGNWLLNRFCRRSCFDAGHGYEGDVCCGDGTAASRLLLRRVAKN